MCNDGVDDPIEMRLNRGRRRCTITAVNACVRTIVAGIYQNGSGNFRRRRYERFMKIKYLHSPPIQRPRYKCVGFIYWAAKSN